MRMRNMLGRTPLGLLIAMVTIGAVAVVLSSHTALRAEGEGGGPPSGMGGPPSGMGSGAPGGGMGAGSGMPGMGGGGMPGMGGSGMPGMGGAGAAGGGAAAAAPALTGGQIEEGMVMFPDVPGISGLQKVGSFYRFTYTESGPGGSDTIRVELPDQLEGKPLYRNEKVKHFPEMWGQIFHIFEAGSAQRAGELPEERDARLAGAKAGSKLMQARSAGEAAARPEKVEGALPEEQLAIQRGIQAGSDLAADRVRRLR